MQFIEDTRFLAFVLFPALVFVGYVIWQVTTSDRRALARMRDDHARVHQELRRLESSSGEFEVWGYSGIVVSLLLTIAAGLIVAYAVSIGSPLGILFATAVCFGVLLKWQRVWPQFRRPMLLLSSNGIDSIDYGFIPWQAVKGVHLSRYQGRGGGQMTLELLVPTLRDFKSQFKPSLRLFFSWRIGPARHSLRILLTLTRVHPEVVYGVAEQLWRKMTGIRTHWLPNDPQFNQAEQTLEIEMSRLEKMGTNDPQAVMQQLRRVENASFELQKGAWNPSVTVRQAIAVVFLVLALLVLLFAMSVNR